MESATASSEHFANRASKVDIDHCKPGFDKLLRSERELFGLGSHELACNWVFLWSVVQKVLGLLAILEIDKELVKHDFAQGVRRPSATCDYSHCPVAVSTKCCLDDRKPDEYISDFQFRSRQCSLLLASLGVGKFLLGYRGHKNLVGGKEKVGG